ncbi:E3 ubiquitin-protein ligase ATL4-like [Abrus precatorius]|uniref:RING-type E3 ubiquitin transferase n=1 Tax=Abrus precatorius TaxID=3816 RepID=A0A8B8K0J9_ABRPR|nr:E3 ubiquitin-protein ligase ATL4-like [Abrus precatorius]
MASPPPLTLNVVGSDTFPTVSSSLTPPSPRRSSPLQNLSPSILIIVTVLAVTVIISLALCFLLRHLNRRCLRRFSSTSAAPSAAATPIFTSSRRISPEIPHSSTSVIDSLPLFTFSSVTRRSAAVAGDCAVCLSKFRHDDLLRLLPLCCHAFHAECIDTWLQSNLSCPLCRSAIVAADSDLAKVLRPPSSAAGSSDSFRLEIGNISRRGTEGAADGGGVRGGSRSRSYSIGSFDYLVDDESEVPYSHARRRSVDDHKEFPVASEAPGTQHEASLAGEVAGVRSWLKDYMDRVSASISSRTASFRSSGRFFSGGSSRRSDVVPVAADYDLEGNRIGEEISEMFRWLSGV